VLPWRPAGCGVFQVRQPNHCATGAAYSFATLCCGARVQETVRRIAATIACHAAVKANHVLTYDKMVHILAELRATAYSTICPHGRPVMLRMTRREIEKNFQRT